MSRRIAVFAFPGAQMLDIAGPMEVFSQANHLGGGEPAYDLLYLGPDGGPVTLSSGLSLLTTPFTESGEIDTLIIPGGSEAGLRGLVERRDCLDWIRARGAEVRRLASVCTGAFVLGSAHLLDGRPATTHWASCGRLQAMFPAARVEREVIFTVDGHLHTSAGVSTGIDLALHLLEQDLGRTLAFRVARHLVLYLRRSAATPQDSHALAAQAVAEHRLGEILDYILGHPAADLEVATLAHRAAMSERHFARRFRAETGQSVARFVLSSRLEQARLLLGETDLRLKQITERCGFGSADVLGRRFRERFGVTPAAYRRSRRSNESG